MDQSNLTTIINPIPEPSQQGYDLSKYNYAHIIQSSQSLQISTKYFQLHAEYKNSIVLIGVYWLIICDCPTIFQNIKDTKYQIKLNQQKIIESKHMSVANSRIPKKAVINTDRLNPEFIGIAEKYSKHKRNRLESDDQRKKVTSNFIYAMKFHQQLEKNLNDKKQELQKLQQIRKRHNEDIRHKMAQQQRKRREEEQLRNQCQIERTNLKNGIKNAKNTVKLQNFNSKIQTKNTLDRAMFQFESQSQRKYQQQCMRHRSIQIGKKIGNQRVNEFYRTQNMRALNNYMKMIEQEDKKSDQNNNQVSHLSKKLQKLQININKKQNRLKNVVDQISLYSVETPHERKINHLANTTVYGWGFESTGSSRTSRKKKDRSGTASSNRSRPSDLLRKSFKEDRQRVLGNKSGIEQTL